MITPTFEPLTASLITISSIIGSYIPDIDEPNSKIGKRIRLLSKILKFIFKHRGIIHTPFFGILLMLGIRYGLASFVPPEYLKNILLGFFVGYASHLLLDTITSRGIMWLWPISTKYISTQSELFVQFLIMTSALVYFYFKYDLLNLILQSLKL